MTTGLESRTFRPGESSWILTLNPWRGGGVGLHVIPAGSPFPGVGVVTGVGVDVGVGVTGWAGGRTATAGERGDHRRTEE